MVIFVILLCIIKEKLEKFKETKEGVAFQGGKTTFTSTGTGILDTF